MKRVTTTVVLAGLITGLASCTTKDSSQFTGARAYSDGAPSADYYRYSETRGNEPGTALWPRRVVSGSTTNLIYHPQIDSWDGRQVVARNAVGIQGAGQAQPTYGVVTLRAITLVDKTRRVVSLENIQILGGDFPSAQNKTQQYLEALREAWPRKLEGLSLDFLETSFTAAPGSYEGSARPLNNAPPRIIFSTRPALLVYIDGPPVYRPVTGTELQRVINCRLLLIKDRSGQHYLHILNGFMQAPRLEGPWTVANQAPNGSAEAQRQGLASATPVDLLEAPTDSATTNPPPSLTSATAPVVYVATTPTELLQFDGQPDFVPIAGTHLLYAANTPGNVFQLLTDQRLYVLISGRWFRAASLYGPWQFVPATSLPQDFANIPDSSPKENVKASVPGTQQAAEALIANSIPESTNVDRTLQIQQPKIDGPPRLEAIAGTPLYYVVNSDTPIIKVDEQSWYACQNGVWFVATGVNGPWTVAASVPAVIYSIPPGSPLHYVTYVQVYGATPQEVYEGYTPGYMGTEVEDGVVVYGTGYCYPPWIGGVWYGYPVTWGFGWGPCWAPWDDWCFGLALAFAYGGDGWGHCRSPAPWWGPHRHCGGDGGIVAWKRGATLNTAANVYHPSRIPTTPVSVASGHSDGVNNFGRAYNSRTGILVAGQRAGVRIVSNTMQVHSARESEYRSARTFEVRGAPPGHRGNDSYGGREQRGSFGSHYGAKSPFADGGRSLNGSGYSGNGLYGRSGAGGWRGYASGGSFYGGRGSSAHAGSASGGGHSSSSGGSGSHGGGGSGSHGGGGGGGSNAGGGGGHGGSGR